MLNNLKYKTKNRLLLVIVFVFGYLSYQFAIKKTINLYSDYRTGKMQMDFAKNIPEKTVQLKSEIEAIDKTLLNSQQNETNVQQNLLSIVTMYCKENTIVLREFPQMIQTSGNEFLIETNTFKIEGSFIKLLQLLYILEQKRRIGKIASVSFLTKTDFKTKKPELTATVYLQHVSKKEVAVSK